MSNTYSASTPQAMEKLLEAMDKGIDLLINQNLDKDLYDAFERYVISTLKLVDVYCRTSYEADFVQFSNNSIFNQFNIPADMGVCSNPMYLYNNSSFLNVASPNPIVWNNPYMPNCGIGISKQTEINYQDKLKEVLKKLVSIAKIVAYK